MEKLDNLNMSLPILCLLDTDVIINWLTQEEDMVTNEKLWEAPYKIIKLITNGKIKGISTLINLLEIRFVLRRKKDFDENKIKEDLEKIIKTLEIIIPDEVNLLKANSLQQNFPLSPFDAIIIATSLAAAKDVVLISRDKTLLQISSKFLSAVSPEQFLSNIT